MTYLAEIDCDACCAPEGAPLYLSRREDGSERWFCGPHYVAFARGQADLARRSYDPLVDAHRKGMRTKEREFAGVISQKRWGVAV